MALGNEIVLASNPRGLFKEGIISGTPKPGTLMTIVAATEKVGGRFTWEPFNRDADGDRALVAVLLPDTLQGALATDAYVDGERCFLYCPAAGEEMNVLVSASGTGTGDSIAIGDLLIAVDGTGVLIGTTGDPESEPFQVLETATDVVAAGTLLHCVYTGH